MKRVLLTCTLVAVTGLSIHAQKGGGFAKGDKLLNAGIGLNSYYSGGIPAGVSLELGISDVLSVGANADYVSSTYKYSGWGIAVKEKFTSLYLGARLSYHANEILNINNDKVDLYAGATAGFRSFSFRNNYSSDGLASAYSNGVFIGAYIGGRYYFTGKIGGFAELGAIGSTNARIGAAFKF
ncbi:MAG: hypothetical protein U0V75_14400 [Ferruginibacter sp.]